MKRNFFLMASLCAIANTGFSQMTIEGTVKDHKNEVISIGYFLPNMRGKKDTLQVAGDGSFSYTSKPQSMQWALNIDKVSLYLHADSNDHLRMTITPGTMETMKVEFSGDKAAENNYLISFYAMANLNEQLKKSSFISFRKYRAMIDQKDKEARKKLNAISEPLRAKWVKRQDMARLYMGLEYYFHMKKADPVKARADKDYAAFISKIDPNGEWSTNSNVTGQIIDWRIDDPSGKSTEDKRIRYLDMLQQMINNEKTVNDHATQYISMLLGASKKNDLKEVMEKYKQVCTDTARVRQMQDRYEIVLNRFKIVEGIEAPDFSMVDVDGKRVKLSDLRGKMVYIDVWATWCVPCVAEIPHLADLHQKFANDPRIEFISISVDSKPEPWVKKVKADKPEWKQFLAEGGLSSTLYRTYGIEFIPRFMLIDKNGKIAALNYLRPSDEGSAEDLKKRLDAQP
ncbi:MAG: TlpA family protein disulfide reductase [Chitinophagaceae bacterium]|nr:TlpA family protein disulfide reductase [Chitinophagaceae bacterium]